MKVNYLRIATLIWIYTIFLILIGSYQTDFFDTALTWLAIKYTSLGLVPYQDFGVVYPPGLFALFGYLKISNSFMIQIAASVIYFLILVKSYRLLQDLAPDKKSSSFYFAAIIASQSIILRIAGFYGAIPINLFLLTWLLSLKLNKWYDAKDGWLFLSLNVLGMWVRWDWWIFLFTANAISVIWDGSAIKLTKLSAVGSIAGITSLVIYAAAVSSVKDAWLFIVELPVMLASGYRYLPLPKIFTLQIQDLVIYPLIALFIYWFLLLVKQRNLVRDVLPILIGPAVLLPYALGRSDYGHFVPLLATTLVASYLLSNTSFRFTNLKTLWVVLGILTLPWFLDRSSWLLPKPGRAVEDMQSGVLACSHYQESSQAKSVFVGRISYDKYLFNYVNLYLTYPTLPPATRFITDEPGIQNNCRYGELIVQDLTAAPKPMIAFLDTSEHFPQNEMTEKMKSCGKIETFLNSRTYTRLGQCTAYGSTIDVRVYH